MEIQARAAAFNARVAEIVNCPDTTEALGEYLWDFYKAYYGFRPRFVDLADREDVARTLASVEADFEGNKETFEGRQFLRNQGWLIEETDPELIARAEFLAEQERQTVDNLYKSEEEVLYGPYEEGKYEYLFEVYQA